MAQVQQTAKQQNDLEKHSKLKPEAKSAGEDGPNNPAVWQVMEMLGSWRKMAESEGLPVETFFNPATGWLTMRVGNLRLLDGKFESSHVGNIEAVK